MAAFLELLKFYSQASIRVNAWAPKGIVACRGAKYQALAPSFRWFQYCSMRAEQQVQSKSSDEMVKTIF